jgi:hypothetical protein
MILHWSAEAIARQQSPKRVDVVNPMEESPDTPVAATAKNTMDYGIFLSCPRLSF